MHTLTPFLQPQTPSEWRTCTPSVLWNSLRVWSMAMHHQASYQSSKFNNPKKISEIMNVPLFMSHNAGRTQLWECPPTLCQRYTMTYHHTLKIKVLSYWKKTFTSTLLKDIWISNVTKGSATHAQAGFLVKLLANVVISLFLRFFLSLSPSSPPLVIHLSVTESCQQTISVIIFVFYVKPSTVPLKKTPWDSIIINTLHTIDTFLQKHLRNPRSCEHSLFGSCT